MSTLYRDFHSRPSRSFTIPTSATESISISITEPGLVADNLPLETWASSSILASQLYQIPTSFPDSVAIPILELGAGTGLVGLTAAHVYGQAVVLTDLPPIVPGLWANITLNPALKGITAGVLDWTKRETLVAYASPEDAEGRTRTCEEGKAHVLLAADTLYSEEHPELLTGAVEAWLSRDPEARFVMGTALRVAYLEELRELWARLEGLGLECVSEGKGEASAEDFDDERLVEWSVWRWKP